jgi:hypothetical protein
MKPRIHRRPDRSRTLGWRLEHTGYYFMITGETSTDRMFVSGEATAISGITMGVYLFRNTALAVSDSPRNPI